MKTALPPQYRLLQTFFPLILKRSRTTASQMLREAVCSQITPEEMEELGSILHLRRRLSQDGQQIPVTDYGTGSDSWRVISEIHRTSSIPHWWGILLFRLVRVLRPGVILELGTNLGVSAAYFQAGLFLNGSGTLTTIEGDPGLASLARANLGRRDPHRVEVVTGRFQDMLAPTLKRIGRVDMAFFDGHHEYEPTMEYFETIRTFLAGSHCIVLDDLYPWMFPLRRAWSEISASGDLEAFDTGKLGILMKGWEGS